MGVCVVLETPTPPCVVPGGVFDDFAWCHSDRLEWRRPRDTWDGATRLDGADPARMAFVLRRASELVPTELARVHAFGLGLGEERALAPWAIDDATDAFHRARVRPGELLWLAADNLNALFWGLHDWAHFHNHGPFDERAWTELQCDATALAWLTLNRERVPVTREDLDRLAREVKELTRSRFAAEGAEVPDTARRALEAASAGRMLPPGSG